MKRSTKPGGVKIDNETLLASDWTVIDVAQRTYSVPIVDVGGELLPDWFRYPLTRPVMRYRRLTTLLKA